MKRCILSQQSGLPTPPPRTAERQRQEVGGRDPVSTGHRTPERRVTVTETAARKGHWATSGIPAPFFVCGPQAGHTRLESDPHGGCCHCWLLPGHKDMWALVTCPAPLQVQPHQASCSGGQGPHTHLRGMSTRRSGFGRLAQIRISDTVHKADVALQKGGPRKAGAILCAIPAEAQPERPCKMIGPGVWGAKQAV